MAAELAGEATFALETAVWTLAHETNLEPTGGESQGQARRGNHSSGRLLPTRCRMKLSTGRPYRHVCTAGAGRGETSQRRIAGRRKCRRGLEMAIGAPGFEPGTSCSQSRRATGLRHTPKLLCTNVLLRLAVA